MRYGLWESSVQRARSAKKRDYNVVYLSGFVVCKKERGITVVKKDAVNVRSKVEMIHQKGAGREVNQGSP